MSSPTEIAARRITARLHAAGHTAWFAGGCVRDHLRGVEPHDFDIATSAHPEEVQRLFPRNVAVGAHFGVIVVLDGELSFEVATFRSDEAYIDGRRPTGVRFTTPQQDAERRDFTINAMFFDPEVGEVIDYVEGRADLEKRLIRAVGDASHRFAEDKLRMLRAVRFATTLNFEIEPSTWKAIQQSASEVTAVSAERIRDELLKIFRSPHRVRGLDLLDESGLLAVVLPEITALHGCEQPPQFHPEGDVFVHTRMMLGMLAPEVPDSIFLSVLFHDIGKPRTFSYDPEEDRIRFSGHDAVGAKMTLEVMQRLRFPNDEIERVVAAVANHMVFKDVTKMRVSKLKRFMARPDFDREIELHRVDCSSSHGDLGNIEFLREKAEEFANEPLIPPPLITGRDLIDLGLRPGPQFKELLEIVETAQLENRVSTREEALQLVKEQIG
ncbi:MAG TPA: CCA tRNA nucleotidyltransferase [Chthoniobacterales bacterium]|jgi:poly(A) polymerase